MLLPVLFHVTYHLAGYHEDNNCNGYIISKCLERCIFSKIYYIIDQQIQSTQHGFRQGHSTTTQLVDFYNEILGLLDSGTQCDTVFLDLSKAFDSVPHHLLIHKIQKFGINGRLLDCMDDS